MRQDAHALLYLYRRAVAAAQTATFTVNGAIFQGPVYNSTLASAFDRNVLSFPAELGCHSFKLDRR